MELPSNSNASKQPQPESTPEPKRVERVVTGEVSRRKPPLGKRLKETFIGGTAGSVWEYVVFEVLVPAAKDTIADVVTQAIERTLFGEGRSVSRRSGSRPSGVGGFVQYNRVSPAVTREDPRRPDISRRARVTHDFEEVVIPSRAEANEVLDRMYDLLSKFEQVTVSDFYDLVGITANYTDNKYGWTSLAGAGVSRVRDGFVLNLPQPQML